MGTTLSTVTLLVGTLVTTVFSSIAANNARTQVWDKAKLWSGITAALSILLILVTLFIVVRSRAIGSIFTPGIVISYILLTLIMAGVAVLEVMASLDAADEDSKAMWNSVLAACISCVGFVIALIIIVILL